MKYKDAGIPLCILAGKEYGCPAHRGTGSERPFMQGVKPVIADEVTKEFTACNLIGPWAYCRCSLSTVNQSKRLNLTGTETFNIDISDTTVPQTGSYRFGNCA